MRGHTRNITLAAKVLICAVASILAIISSSLTGRDDLTSLSTIPCVQSNSPRSSTNLAYEQSFGFFDDIPNYAWREAQNIHAKLFPNHYSNDLLKYSNGIGDKGKFDKLKNSNWWNGENFQEEFHCMLAQRIPETGQADGPKWLCDPYRLRRKPDCLVYSFGRNGKVEFEEGIQRHVGRHCEIHTFDMVLSNKRNGNFADRLQGYATFHPWGLGTEEQAASSPTKFKTLRQTMEALNHTGRTIDVFKIDCEW